MKLKQVTIAERDEGIEVSVVALLAHGEKLVEFDFSNLVGPLFSSTVSRDTSEPKLLILDEASSVTKEMWDAAEINAPVKIAEEPQPQPETRRRRHRNPLEEAAPEATESPTESPRRRRRAASTSESPAPLQSPAVSTDASSSAGEGQSDANPTRRRRRNEPANDAASPTSAEPSTSTASTEEPRRRRRAAATEEQSTTSASPAPASSEDKITDADLSKACSDAARVLTPKVVMEYLKTFGVASAGELKAADRRRFLDGLKAKKEAA